MKKTAETKPTVKVESLAAVWRGITPEYRDYLRIVVLFGIGNSSDAFLLLQAQQQGFDAPKLLLLYALFNITEALLAYQAGRLSGTDSVVVHFWPLAILSLPWCMRDSRSSKNERAVYGLFILYGLYYTLTQGTQRALAADLAKPSKRGAEIGLYHFTVGILALPSSLLAGWLLSEHRIARAIHFRCGNGFDSRVNDAFAAPCPKEARSSECSHRVPHGFQAAVLTQSHFERMNTVPRHMAQICEVPNVSRVCAVREAK